MCPSPQENRLCDKGEQRAAITEPRTDRFQPPAYTRGTRFIAVVAHYCCSKEYTISLWRDCSRSDSRGNSTYSSGGYIADGSVGSSGASSRDSGRGSSRGSGGDGCRDSSGGSNRDSIAVQ